MAQQQATAMNLQKRTNPFLADDEVIVDGVVKKINNLNCGACSNDDLKLRSSEINQESNKTMFYCPICAMHIQGENNRRAHMLGKEHRKASSLKQAQTSLIYNGKPFCGICKLEFPGSEAHAQHLISGTHARNMIEFEMFAEGVKILQVVRGVVLEADTGLEVEEPIISWGSQMDLTLAEDDNAGTGMTIPNFGTDAIAQPVGEEKQPVEISEIGRAHV